MRKQEILLKKINGLNERLKQLKLQGESSSSKTLKNVRKRRNDFIKELVKLLQPTTSFYDEIKKENRK